MLQQTELHCQHPGAIHLVQLTDTHLPANADDTLVGVNTSATLGNVIAALQRREAPDLVVITGDLAETPAPQAYKKLVELTQRINAPVFCLPGNHDDPAMMRELLNTGNLSTANFLSIGRWSIILLNTHKAGARAGYLSAAGLADLDTALQRSADRYVLICLHHPPVTIQSPWMDAMGLKNNGALFQITDRYRNVKGIIWGHIHQEFSAHRNGALLLGSPSTCIQFLPHSERAAIDDKPPAYRDLTLTDDGVIRTRIHWL